MFRGFPAVALRLVNGVASSSASKTGRMSLHASALLRLSDASAAPEKIISIKNFDVPLDDKILPAVSLATASSMEIVNYKKSVAVKKFQIHTTDTGSTPVQIATLTERILNMSRHQLQHKKDAAGQRGYQMMLSRRKRLMQYLKRTDLTMFKTTVTRLGLEKEASHLK